MTRKSDEDPYLCRKEAARYLGGFSPDTLAVWDCTGKYDLQPIKVGRNVRYRRSSLDRFAQSSTTKSIVKKSGSSG